MYRLEKEDLKRIKGHDARTLDVFRMRPFGDWIPVSLFETETGSTRIAARIHQLRKHLEIETRRGAKGRAEYRVIGKDKPQIRNPHCSTCVCHEASEVPPEMQSKMQF